MPRLNPKHTDAEQEQDQQQRAHRKTVSGPETIKQRKAFRWIDQRESTSVLSSLKLIVVLP